MSDDNHNIDDVEFIEDEDFSGEASIDKKLKKLREKLKVCESEKAENLSGWQRAKADLVNAKKELEADRPRLISMGKTSLVEDLLPTLDSFSMAMKGEAWQSVDEKWRLGVEYIYNQLITAIEQNGIESIEPNPGDSIDHNLHDVVGHDDGSDTDAETIVSVRRKGYKINSRIIRPAEVITGK